MKTRNPISKRNPIAKALRDPSLRARRGKSTEERADQRDQWSRNAKYKKNDPIVEASKFQIGDDVKVPVDKKKKKGEKREKGHDEGMVKTPNGPADLVGVTVDGKYCLYHEDELTLIQESLQRLWDLSQ